MVGSNIILSKPSEPEISSRSIESLKKSKNFLTEISSTTFMLLPRMDILAFSCGRADYIEKFSPR